MSKLHFDLTAEQVNIILSGLAELPLKISMETFMIVKQQAEAQLQESQITTSDSD
jgi:hypothetical protein